MCMKQEDKFLQELNHIKEKLNALNKQEKELKELFAERYAGKKDRERLIALINNSKKRLDRLESQLVK